METKILIFGKGYLGSRIGKYSGGTVVSTDITDAEAVREVLAEHQPEIVINTAAKTLTGQLENPEFQAEAHKVNVDGALNVARACQVQDIYLVHISTAMMFDGPDITEETEPNPQNYYAGTKAEADALLKPYNPLITRIHTPLSKYAHPRNLLTKLQGFDKTVSEPSSITVVEDYLDALKQLIEKRAAGIYNVVNPGSISLYEIACMMKKEVTALSKAEILAMIEASGGAVQTYPILKTDKLEALGIKMRPVKEAVQASINEYQ